VAGEDGTGREHGVNRRNRNRQIGKQTLKQTENLKFSSSPTLMWSTLVHVSILRIMDALIDISPWGAVGRRRRVRGGSGCGGGGLMNMQVGRQEGSSKPARNIRESARTPFGFGWVKGTLVWASSSR